MIKIFDTSQKKGKFWIFLLLCSVFFTALIFSYFRNAIKDDALYLKETLIIWECLKDGQWFGNEAVGVHGFLFKIPAALLFLITGPSVWVATFTNIIMALLSLVLVILIFKHFFSSTYWVFFSCFLIITSYHFVLFLSTFLREIPVLFSLLLFCYFIVKKKSIWIIGIGLMLVLDAKESVFFLIFPGFILFVLLNEFFKNKKIGLHFLKKSLYGLFSGILPSFIFLFLMFTTGIIPLNVKAAHILLLNKGGLKTFLKLNLNATRGSRNPWRGGKEIFKLPVFDNYGWKANFSGKVILLPEVLTEKKMPVVKLVKLSKESTHRSKGYPHSCRHLIKPDFYSTKDIIIYSLWYKISDKHALDLFAYNWMTKQWRNAGFKRIKLIKNGKWHFVKVEIPVTKDAVLDPGFLWSYGRGMILYVAGCNIEKKDLKINGKENKRVVSSIKSQQPIPSQQNLFGKDPSFNSPIVSHNQRDLGGSKIKAWLIYIWRNIGLIINIILSYIGKILYPRTFSFISVPKFIILPAFAMSFTLFNQWRIRGEYQKLIFPLFFWSSLFIYVIQWSHGRYLFPLIPIIILFFIYFLSEGIKKTIFTRNILIATTLFVAMGLYFENNYRLIKILLNFVVLLGLWGVFYLQNKRIKHVEKFKYALIVVIGIFTFTVAISSSILLPGQIGRYALFGYNSEYKKIVSHFLKNERVWINTNPHLMKFYRGGKFLAYHFNKTHLMLQDWVPKKRMLRLDSPQYTYHFSWKKEDEFEGKIRENGIEKVAMVVSTLKSKKFQFYLQDRLKELEKMDFLELEKKVPLKNKILYVFKVT